MPHLLTAFTAAVLLALVPAQADAGLRKGIWGPSSTPAFDGYKAAGADIYNVQLVWRTTAPTRPADPRNPADPAYQWPERLDRVLELAQARGIEVSLLVRGTPAWANGGALETRRPDDPRDFANFVRAASRRYPQVRLWQIWGETNGGTYQWWPRVGAQYATRLNRAQRETVEVYAEMLDRAYGQLRAQSRRNRVIGGMTVSLADETGMPPATWAKYLRRPNGKRPRMHMWGHNPFQLARRPRLSSSPKHPGWRDMSDLDTFLREINRYHRRPGRKRQKLGFYISEWSVWSDHPGPSNWFVDRKTQARWLKDGFRIARKYKQVYALGWFRWNDADGERPTGFGLVDAQGAPKPAFDAYRRQ